MPDRFFEDPYEIDSFFFPILEYINHDAWDLVLEKIEQLLSIYREKLSAIDKAYPKSNFYLIAEAESVSDVLHSKGGLRAAEHYPEIMETLLDMREALRMPGDEPHDRQSYIADVERLRRGIKAILLEETAPIASTRKASLSKGRKAGKGLKSLKALVGKLMVEHAKKNNGESLTGKDLIRKLRRYTDDDPFKWKNYELKFDPEANKIYQLDVKTGKGPSVHTKQVYEYRSDILKKIKKSKKKVVPSPKNFRS